ncbi:alkaline phosphatase PafA [uncultured Prevotella sp.]|uniref:alkaline phosphatase PafA n=1 Tax=uncultured Prevotella sp. TaxID=159272 RepID=UPI0035B0EB2B
MMKKIKVISFLSMALLGCGTASAQQSNAAAIERPKLVVGIVVDQMRWDYLYRYQKRYTDGGFKRLLGEGFSCENTMIPYVPSVTAIGHTCIYTGSVPSIHGIAGNNFVKDGKKVYCTDDDSIKPVGTTSGAALMSPRNLWVSTIGDEMKIASNGRAKVVGVALKDRASILPAGHNPNGAFWFDDQTGCFITSSYYMDRLPKWVEAFNDKRLPEQYLSQKWNTLYPKNTYTESTTDENEYENGIREGVKATLPLNLPELYKKYGYGIIRNTPFGNSLTLDMAKAAIDGEQLGADDETDLLAVSCSSTDYIGHQVGTHAIETEDTYLRLDKAIADFLTYLDSKVGKGNYLVFLSADHGAMNNAAFLQDRRIPAGSWDASATAKKLNHVLAKEYPEAGDIVKTVMNYQVFFNRDVIKSKQLDFDNIKQTVVNVLKEDPSVLYACDMAKASTESIPEEVKSRIINGYNRERSGDVVIILKPNFYAHGMKGTDHGAWNSYDTHIPLVFMGWGIKHGATTKQTFMTDIAPTIAAMLHVQAPNGCVGKAIFGNNICQ